MSQKKFLIVGSGGREGAFALRLVEDTHYLPLSAIKIHL